MEKKEHLILELFKNIEKEIKNLIYKIDKNSFFDIDEIEKLFKLSYKGKMNINSLNLRQHIKNVCSNMFKNNEIIRIKRNLYTFNEEFIELINKIDEENNKYVIRDLYFDYLNERTNALPVNSNIFVSEEIFRNKSKELRIEFLKKYKNIKILEEQYKVNNEKELFLFKIYSYFIKSKFIADDILRYAKEKTKEKNIKRNVLNLFLENNKKNINKTNFEKFNNFCLTILQQ